MPKIAFSTLLLTLALPVLLGCGQSEGLSEGEPSGKFKVEIVSATFPESQHLGEPVELKIKVRNVDNEALPQLAITVDSFTYRSKQPGLADPNRPIWTVGAAPPGSKTAFTNTYRFGRLAPGHSKEATWKLQAVKAGTFTVKYKIAAGLTGKAVARLADGSAAEGAFVVTITSEPDVAS